MPVRSPTLSSVQTLHRFALIIHSIALSLTGSLIFRMSVDVQALLAAQNQGLTVGAVPPAGKTAIRLEIDDFIQDADLTNLYFLALEEFMANKAWQQPFGYYEISGIHGQPTRPWDNVTPSDVPFPQSGGQPSSSAGYCAHGSVLFPVWHRVYLAQFEVCMTSLRWTALLTLA